MRECWARYLYMCVEVTTSVEYFQTFRRANEKALIWRSFQTRRIPKRTRRNPDDSLSPSLSLSSGESSSDENSVQSTRTRRQSDREA